MVDPETLIEGSNVLSSTETVGISAEEAGEYRNLDSHVAVGITNRTGEVLLADDGSHGPGLPARPVNRDGNWADAAREIVERVFDESEYELSVAKIRRTVFVVEDGTERIRMHDVIFEVHVPDGEELPDPDVDDTRYESVEWASAVPDEQDGAMAEDVRLFL